MQINRAGLALLCLLLSTIWTALSLFSAQPSHAQDPITQQVLRKLIPGELPALITTRFHADDKKLADVTWYREEDGRFQNYFSGPIKVHGSDFCTGLLEAAQNFPLHKMVDTNYISSAQKDVLQRLGDRLDLSQFRFYEKTRPVDLDEVKNLDVTRGDIALATLPLLSGNQLVEVEATLWSVSAQTTSSHVRKQFAKMPWQLDEAYADIPVDRKKYSLAWEVGRAAQKAPRNFQRLVGAAALEILYEVLAYGESPDDAYLFAHALGPMQKRVFQMPKIPGTQDPIFQVFHEADAEKGDVVLIAKLKDVLAHLPPENTSKRLHDAMQVASGELDIYGLTEHVFKLRDSIQQSLDIVRPGFGDRRYPILLRDLTQIPGWYMAEVSKRYGVYDGAGPRLARHFSGYIQDYSHRGSHFIDKSIPPSAALASFRPVTISNLNPEYANKDPQYVLRVLFASYLYYTEKFRKAYPDHAPEVLPQINYVITTSEGSVVQQAIDIAGVQRARVEFPDVSARIDSSPEGLSMQPKLRIESQPAFVFSDAAIRELLRKHPRLAIEAKGALKRGNFQIMQHKMESLF